MLADVTDARTAPQVQITNEQRGELVAVCGVLWDARQSISHAHIAGDNQGASRAEDAVRSFGPKDECKFRSAHCRS